MEEVAVNKASEAIQPFNYKYFSFNLKILPSSVLSCGNLTIFTWGGLELFSGYQNWVL